MKQKRYWLRGGIVGAILATILLMFFFYFPFFTGFPLSDGYFVTLFPVLTAGMWGSMSATSDLMAHIIFYGSIVISIGIYFALGAAVSLIYKRSRRKN